MSWQAARIIDFHAHVVLEETFGAAGEHGPELTIAEDGRPLFRAGGYRLHGVRYRGSPFMDAEVRLAAMDRAGIDCQVLSPNPLTYFHFIDVPSAVAFCSGVCRRRSFARDARRRPRVGVRWSPRRVAASAMAMMLAQMTLSYVTVGPRPECKQA